MNFFIKTNKGVFGPFTQEQIRSNVKQGKIKSHHLISSSKTGDFQKITKEFLSGEHGSLSSRSESPPELGAGNSFDNPTSIQLSKPKKLRNSRKPKSRRELLEGSSIASTPAHAFSHRSNMEERFADLNKAAKNGSSRGQLLGLLMFVLLGVSIFGVIYVGRSFSDSISQLVSKDTSNDPLWEEYERLRKEYDSIEEKDVNFQTEEEKELKKLEIGRQISRQIEKQLQKVQIIQEIDQKYPLGTYRGESIRTIRIANEKLLKELYKSEDFYKRL